MSKFIILREHTQRVSGGHDSPDSIISTVRIEEAETIDEALKSIQERGGILLQTVQLSVNVSLVPNTTK